jgi:VWFA-related protein
MKIQLSMFGLIVVAGVAGLYISGLSRAQENPPNPSSTEQPKEFQISSHSDLVLLDVSVKDPAGGFVSGLTKDQFKVFDNGREVPITVFEAGDIPVTVGLVVDNSGSMRAKKPDVVTAALTFVTESNPKDEMFVVNFNDRVSFGLPPDMPFTDQRELLRQALLSNRVEGRTALNDAVKLALAHLEKGMQAKKTLVLISDGGDNASEMTASELFRRVEESRATIYSIGVYDAEDRDKNPGFLKKISTLTGGECFLPDKLTELVGVCRKIAKDIRNRYSIGFIPSDSGLTGGVRKLKVVASAADRGKLIVRTRTHYIAATTAAHEITSVKGAGRHQ